MYILWYKQRQTLSSFPLAINLLNTAPVVRRLDKTIHKINPYPVDSMVCFADTYLLDSDLSSG